MNMNLKNLIKKLGFVVILLLINSVKCAESPMDDYVSNVTRKSLISTEKSDWYINFTKYNITNPCGYFNNWFAETNINPKNKQFEDTKKFVEFMLFLAQNSKECWLSLIKDVKEGSDQAFLFERMAGSALRSYIYLLIENKAKWQQTGSWWKNPWQRMKLLYDGIPDFYLVAAVENLRILENSTKSYKTRFIEELPTLVGEYFSNKKQQIKGSYQAFIEDMPNLVRKYLTNIPADILEKFGDVQFSPDEINKIINNLKIKLNPGHLRRYWKYYLTVGAAIGIGYVLIKNEAFLKKKGAELKEEFNTTGLRGALNYTWRELKNFPINIRRSNPVFFQNKSLAEISPGFEVGDYVTLAYLIGAEPQPGSRYAVVEKIDGRLFEYNPNELENMSSEAIKKLHVYEVLEKTPFINGRPVK